MAVTYKTSGYYSSPEDTLSPQRVAYTWRSSPGRLSEGSEFYAEIQWVSRNLSNTFFQQVKSVRWVEIGWKFLRSFPISSVKKLGTESCKFSYREYESGNESKWRNAIWATPFIVRNAFIHVVCLHYFVVVVLITMTTLYSFKICSEPPVGEWDWMEQNFLFSWVTWLAKIIKQGKGRGNEGTSRVLEDVFWQPASFHFVVHVRQLLDCATTSSCNLIQVKRLFSGAKVSISNRVYHCELSKPICKMGISTALLPTEILSQIKVYSVLWTVPAT